MVDEQEEHQHYEHEAHHGHDHNGHQHHGGHAGHHAHMIEDFKKRFWISLILTIPVLVFSPMVQQFLGFGWHFIGDTYVLFGISTVVFFYGGWPFLKGLVDELRDKSPGMMFLIALAIVVAYGYSGAVVFGLEGKIFFWELVTLIDIMLLGHWIEMKSVMRASNALELLIKMMPSEAHLIKDGQTTDIKAEDLKKGDLILIKPGEKVPADGLIKEGNSYLNESMLTGESTPVEKNKDDKVIGGSVNQDGSLKVVVQHTGKDSYLSKVINMVQEAQQSKSKTQNLADKAAAWLAYVALSAGIITLTTWLLLGHDLAFSLERMVTVMVISCPHALGLAIPLVVAISTAVSAKNGLLIRNRTAFENARKITTVLFDKTGTLTKGEFGVTRFEVLDNQFDKEKMLAYASALEQESEHPIGKGIVEKAKSLSLKEEKITDFKSITGKGVQAKIDGQIVMVVSPGYLKENNISLPKEVDTDEAETLIFVLVKEKPVGFIALADVIRSESAEAVKVLKSHGITVRMATGDNEKVAKSVSSKLGLDDYFAEILPDEKQKIVKDLQQKGEFVAMTGDGVNDAPALAQANIGIAVGSGTDVAAETADIVLVNSNPQDITALILFGRSTYKKMIQNLIWAAGYNIFAIPLAAGVLYSFGILLSPAIGAVLMSLSTVIVALNAQLLKKQMKK